MSWKKVKLGDICTIEKGATGIQKAIEGDYPLVVTGEERKSHNEFQFDDEAVLIPLVSGTGHGHASLKRIHFQSGKFALGTILCAVIPKNKEQLSAEYLFRFLDLNKENELVARMKGMANVTLPMKEIAQIEIPLPQLKEQIDFVEKYKTLEVYNKTLDTELTHQLNILKQLRQQFLQEAVQGVLIKNDKNTEGPLETGAALLKKIKAEKAKAGKKEKPLAPIKKEEIPFEIPDDWVWCRLGEICEKITDGTHFSPTNLQKGDYKYVTAKNIKEHGVDLSNITYVTKDVHDTIFPRCNPEFGDLLYIKDGATTGIVTINNLKEPFSMLSSVALLKLTKVISNRFLKYIMQSPFFYDAMRADMYGVSITRVTLIKIQNAIIPLPPLSIQAKIVEKVNSLMGLCDAIEGSIRASQKQNEGLLQEVLRAALAG
jgi:type I restriction enzyme, S subunit